MWMTASGAVGNHALTRCALWTTGTHPHHCRAVPTSCPRVTHPSSAVPPATMWLIHRIHRPYDDDETYEEMDPLRLPGDRQLPKNLVGARTQNLGTPARCWLRDLVALGSIRAPVQRAAVSLSAPMYVEGRVTDEVSG